MIEPLAPALPPAREAALREAAQALEAGFLTEMLKHSGLGRTPEAMGGGAGEDAFASLLAREQAEAMAEAGGIGLARSIYEALARAEAPR
jgi:Rod binding domain-containing protein